jgi:phosphonate transport system substrate-binding protein
LKKILISLCLFTLLFPAAAGANEPELRVAVSSMLSPKETFVEYKKMVDYIGRKAGMKTALVQGKDYARTDVLLKQGKVDLAFICSGPYVKDHDEFGVELLAAPMVGGSLTYRSYIVVRRDSPLGSLKELKNKKFAFTDARSNTGCWVPKYMISTMGDNPGTFFSSVVMTNGHDNSIEAVSKGLVDGAGIDSVIFNYMKVNNYPSLKNIKVIEQSSVYAMPPVVVPKSLDPSLKSLLKRILLNMDKDPEGKKILGRLLVDRFFTPADKDYDSIREMENFMNGKKK